MSFSFQNNLLIELLEQSIYSIQLRISKFICLKDCQKMSTCNTCTSDLESMALAYHPEICPRTRKSTSRPSICIEKGVNDASEIFPYTYPNPPDPDTSEIVPYNEVCGYAPGHIAAFSNKSTEFFSMERHIFHGLYMGFKWQAVEFARRWALIKHGLYFGSIPTAARIWTDLHTVKKATDGTEFSVYQRNNGYPAPPKSDSYLVWPVSTTSPFGHIAVITAVILFNGGPTRERVQDQVGVVRVAEQNRFFHKWNRDFSREFPLLLRDGLYYIEDALEPVIGWLEIENGEKHQPIDFLLLALDDLHECLWNENDKGRGKPSLSRITLLDTTGISRHGFELPWLDRNDPAESFYYELMQDLVKEAKASVAQTQSEILAPIDFTPIDTPNTISYYRASSVLLFEIASAANKFHRIFVKAAEKIIANDEMLEKCAVPRALWSKVRRSFVKQRNLILSGRFDFGFDGQTIKVFEYNADSASTMLECGRLQQKWADAAGLGDEGMSPGRFVHGRFVDQWLTLCPFIARHEGIDADSQTEPLVHLLIDDDFDEKYSAHFVANTMREAGLRYKIVVGLDSLQYKGGRVVDADGEVLQVIWKTWAWNTVFDRFEDLQKSRDAARAAGELAPEGEPWRADGMRPELSDLLLDDSLLVFEPLWKAVPASKAVLVQLWKQFPNHPLLLNSSFELTNELRQSGFASKPIRGRGGQHVKLFRPDGSVVEASGGHARWDDMMFQALVTLPEQQGWFATIGAWIVGEQFAGFGIREDRSRITIWSSPYAATRIIWDS